MRRRAHRPDGFTLVEVMIAIGIMTVGSLGILSMHHAVTRANRDARDMNTALAITETWIERVERDSLYWTVEGKNTLELQNNTLYLRTLNNINDETAWFRPAPVDLNVESYAFDYMGQDTPDDIKYCVNLKLSWLREGSSMRVDVRTFWLRGGHVTGAAAHTDWLPASAFLGANCDAATADSWNLGGAPNVNVVFASTVVTWLQRDAL